MLKIHWGNWSWPVIRLGGEGGIAPELRALDPGSNPGPGENFSLKFNKI